VTKTLLSIQVRSEQDVAPVEVASALENVQYHHADYEDALAVSTETEAVPFVRAGEKVGRNDPCPCGSGKKYKQCHGKLS
jgi:preprotein translocase subunit SecA